MARRRTQLAIGAVSILSLGFVVTACGARQAGVPAAPADDPVLVEGREIYIRNCASCHGASGGGGRGPQLNGGRVLTLYPEIDDQVSLVSAGRNNMPAFDEKFSDAQLEAVVRFTREVLAIQ